jgi:cytochrome c oxidase subunit IV
MSTTASTSHPEATRRAIRAALIRNGIVWLALLALIGTSIVAAFLPLGFWCFPLNLALSAIAALIVGILSMGLDRSPALDRLTAAAGFLFILVLFTITFCDIYSRV